MVLLEIHNTNLWFYRQIVTKKGFQFYIREIDSVSPSSPRVQASRRQTQAYSSYYEQPGSWQVLSPAPELGIQQQTPHEQSHDTDLVAISPEEDDAADSETGTDDVKDNLGPVAWINEEFLRIFKVIRADCVSKTFTGSHMPVPMYYSVLANKLAST